MATPRIFISSTYYDLKYVRERLERFIRSYCFEPRLFECDIELKKYFEHKFFSLISFNLALPF